MYTKKGGAAHRRLSAFREKQDSVVNMSSPPPHPAPPGAKIKLNTPLYFYLVEVFHILQNPSIVMGPSAERQLPEAGTLPHPQPVSPNQRIGPESALCVLI